MTTIDQVDPRHDMVLVRRLPDDQITKGGILLPETALNKREGYRIGEVLRVGKGDIVFGETCDDRNYCRKCDAWDCCHCEWATHDTFRFPMLCKPGDRVIYSRCPDNDVTIDGVECTFLREEQHVLAIIDPATPEYLEAGTAGYYEPEKPTCELTENEIDFAVTHGLGYWKP